MSKRKTLRALAACLCLLLALALTAGCGVRLAPDPTEAPDKTDASVPAAADATDPEGSTETPAPPADTLAFTTEEELRAFLTGVWDYVSDDFGYSVLTVELRADGTMTVNRGTSAAYEGTWTLERLDVSDSALPNWLCCSLSDTYPDLWAIGDYLLGPRTIVDGKYMMKWTQVNNGDSVFSQFFDVYAPALEKQGAAEDAAPAERPADSHMYAVFWKESEDGGVLWLDDAIDSRGENTGRHDSIPYPVQPTADQRTPIYSLHPGDVVEIQTDASGAVIMVRKIPEDFDMY